MNPISGEIAEVVDRLRRSKDGQVFSAYLQKAFHEAQQRLIEDTDVARFHVYQGEARVLKVLVEKWTTSNPQAPT